MRKYNSAVVGLLIVLLIQCGCNRFPLMGGEIERNDPYDKGGIEPITSPKWQSTPEEDTAFRRTLATFEQRERVGEVWVYNPNEVMKENKAYRNSASNRNWIGMIIDSAQLPNHDGITCFNMSVGDVAVLVIAETCSQPQINWILNQPFVSVKVDLNGYTTTTEGLWEDEESTLWWATLKYVYVDGKFRPCR